MKKNASYIKIILSSCCGVKDLVEKTAYTSKRGRKRRFFLVLLSLLF